MAIKSLKSSSLTNNVFYRSMLAGNVGHVDFNYFLALTTNGPGGGGGVAAGSDKTLSFGARNANRWIHSGIDSAGELSFSKEYIGAGVTFICADMSSDDDGFIYAAGKVNTFPFVIKFNQADGVVVFAKSFPAAESNEDFRMVGFQPSNNRIYLGGKQAKGSNRRMGAAVINTDGSLHKLYNYSLGGYAEGQGAIGTSAGDIIASSFEEVSSSYPAMIFKWNDAGTLLWGRRIGDGTNIGFSTTSLSIDSSDHLYFGADETVVKLNTSTGVILWQKSFNFGGGIQDTIVDSLDNVYVLSTASSSRLAIVKMNSSGTVQWQRTIEGITFASACRINIDAFDNVLISANANGLTETLVAKLPGDGSLAGTYTVDGNSITYAASSFTSSTGSLSQASGSLSSFTTTNPTLNDMTTPLFDSGITADIVGIS